MRRLFQPALPFSRYGWTTIDGPDFHAPIKSDAQIAAVTDLVRAVGLEDGAWVEQVHGGEVIRAEEAGCLGAADALWTTTPGLGVVGRSADCPLILVGGPTGTGGSVQGFAHASWRSTVAEITATLLQEMTRAGLRLNRAEAVICPSAGPCCYEVGPEVVAAATSRFGPDAESWFPTLKSRPAFDLWLANAAQLEAAGIPAANIFQTRICTICGGSQYPSYRRSGPAAGRFAAIIGGR